MKVRVKYCGGCNPRYERRAVTERLKAAFPQAGFVETGDDEGPFDHVAVICGCSAACAMHGDLHGTYGKTVVSSAGESEGLENALRSIPE